MPKSVEIADFAIKLELVCKKLNWSRAKLAQQVGVDKSLIGRWLGGSSRPTGNSLMRLNEAVGRTLHEFTAAAWDLPPPAFAAGIGLALPPADHGKQPGSPSPAALATTDILKRLRVFQGTAADLDTLTALYAGFYRLWFAGFLNNGTVCRRACWIRRDGETLRFDAGGGMVIYSGECAATTERLYLTGENPVFDGLIFLSVGRSRRASSARLSGIFVFYIMSEEGGIAAVPAVMERLASAGTDTAADARTWARLAAEAADFPTEAAARAAVPEKILTALRPVLDPRRKAFDHILVMPPLD
jgi:transcriptional regulator with XRE-family HTH domain